jgi:hypothetical protein
MQANNHVRVFRPLRGGIAISNPRIDRLGTLGCVVTADGGAERWILTSYHVLGVREADDLQDGEPVFQVTSTTPPEVVARTRRDRSDAGLDVAAARVVDGVESVLEVLGIGPVTTAAEPAAGMRVIKSGVATGVTEGIIRRVDGTRVQIEMPPGFPSKYELSDVSDSGSLWVEVSSRAGVALHFGGNDVGVEKAFAVSLPHALQVLGLDLLS